MTQLDHTLGALSIVRDRLRRAVDAGEQLTPEAMELLLGPVEDALAGREDPGLRADIEELALVHVEDGDELGVVARRILEKIGYRSGAPRT